MKTAKTGIQIHERGRDALCRLHAALSKLGYVREEESGRSPFYIYRREDVKFPRKAAQLKFDIKRHTINAGSNSATLTNHECLLLKYLVEHPRNVVTRDAIPATIFGNTFRPGSDIISPCVCTLRRKLRSIGHANVITTIRGTGYRLSPHYIARIIIISTQPPRAVPPSGGVDMAR
jgi:DNA-binding response OmpR family regulator